MAVSPVLHRLLSFLFYCCLSAAVSAGAAGPPAIALIIDDLGNQQATGLAAVGLPGPVACAFLPDGPFTRDLAGQAHDRGKEVMLHMPMQPADSAPSYAAEPGMLTMDMTRLQYHAVLERDLAAVPHAIGLNNHMGSLLTRHPGSMDWLMQELAKRSNLFFIDSRTTTASVARRLADEYGIPSTQRDVFLDNEQDADAIRGEFRRLLQLARTNGTALAIGHPLPATLQVLQEEIPLLEARGVEVVPVGRLIELQGQEQQLLWQAYSSR